MQNIINCLPCFRARRDGRPVFVNTSKSMAICLGLLGVDVFSLLSSDT